MTVYGGCPGVNLSGSHVTGRSSRRGCVESVAASGADHCISRRDLTKCAKKNPNGRAFRDIGAIIWRLHLKLNSPSQHRQPMRTFPVKWERLLSEPLIMTGDEDRQDPVKQHRREESKSSRIADISSRSTSRTWFQMKFEHFVLET